MGQSIPRKEDKRLVQGQGVFVDDVKRHGMGYVHFVRSPYAHAKIVSIDVSKALELRGRLRDADRRRGRDPDRPVLPDLDAARGARQGLRARGRQGALRRRAGRAVVAETRELARDAAELVEVEYEPLPALTSTRGARSTPTRRSCTTTRRRTSSGRRLRVGRPRRRRSPRPTTSSGSSELHFDRFNSTPLECDGALVEYNRGTGQWTIHTNNQFPGFARS